MTRRTAKRVVVLMAGHLPDVDLASILESLRTDSSHDVGLGNAHFTPLESGEQSSKWFTINAGVGIDADVIRRLAHDYGTTMPAAIRLNYGMQRVRGGGNAFDPKGTVFDTPDGVPRWD